MATVKTLTDDLAQAAAMGNLGGPYAKLPVVPAPGLGASGTQVYASAVNPAEAVYGRTPTAAATAIAPTALQNHIDRGMAMFGQHAPEIVGQVGAIAQRVRAGLQQLGVGGPDPTFHPNPNPLGPPVVAGAPGAARVAALTARKTKIDTAVAGYSGTPANTARIQAYGARADARIGARIAGTPYTKPTTPLPAKTAGTTPIRDLRTGLGLPVRPLGTRRRR